MNDNVIDISTIRNKKMKVETVDLTDMDPKEEALHMAVAMAADMVVFLDESGLYIEDDPKSMGDVYLIIEVLHSLLTRLQHIPTESQKLSEALIVDIDYDEHIEQFREIMDAY